MFTEGDAAQTGATCLHTEEPRSTGATGSCGTAGQSYSGLPQGTGPADTLTGAFGLQNHRSLGICCFWPPGRGAYHGCQEARSPDTNPEGMVWRAELGHRES